MKLEVEWVIGFMAVTVTEELTGGVEHCMLYVLRVIMLISKFIAFRLIDMFFLLIDWQLCVFFYQSSHFV